VGTPWQNKDLRAERGGTDVELLGTNISETAIDPCNGEYSMSITHCKPQQQTLSIRVSESLQEFLELSRQVIAKGLSGNN